MVKREWKEEQVLDIVNGYKDGKTISYLSKKYKAHTYTITNLLRENGIDTSNKRNLTSEEIDTIVSMYLEGNSVTDIRDVIHCRVTTVTEILNSRGIQTSKRDKPAINKNANIGSFTTIDSSIKAYYIGLILADGSVGYDSRTRKDGSSNRAPWLKLEMIDIDAIEKFSSFLNLSTPIKENVREGNNITYSNSINSTKIVEDLERFGIVPNKTYVTPKPIIEDIPDEYIRDFLRGLYDGDGSIGLYNNRVSLALTNYSKSFLEEVQRLIVSRVPIKSKRVKETRSIYKGSAYKLTFTDSYAKDIIEYMYKDASISLDRKQYLANKILFNS